MPHGATLPCRHRCVVEHTLAWLDGFRRVMIRYERRADIHHAFLALGCSNQLHRFSYTAEPMK